jgi:hemoglobin/transferrin/lactoferrin receptor protein
MHHLLVVATLASLLAAQGPVPPQDPPATRSQEPDRTQKPAKTVIVTATRSASDPFELPYATSELTGTEIATVRQARTTPEALKDLPGVSVQKTAHGQGSPKIRGQTGFQTLLLVDGIRINDSTWRSGNVEYWGHLDPYSYERFEIVRGPGSVLWGSDAVSGVGHALQKGRRSFEPGVHAEGMVLGRYASAEHSWTGRAETQGNADAFGWHVGLGYKDYDDLRAGRDVGLLRDTNYTQADGDAKLSWQLDPRQTVSFGIQQVHLRDVPRTHSTNRSVAGWHGIVAGSDRQREHDHRRQLYWLEWRATDGTFFDQATAALAWKERYEREDRITSAGRRDVNVTDVGTLGGYLQFETDVGGGDLVYGLDWYRDFVGSDGRSFAPAGNLLSRSQRGPVAGMATYDLAGAFAQLRVPIGDRFEATFGLRGTYAAMDAGQVDAPGDSLTFNDVDEDWSALTGNLRLLAKPCATTRLFAGASQGFRAPNLSDATRFDVARSGEQEVPAAGLDPERYLTLELGGRHDDGDLALQATGWYTFADDQITRFRTGNTVNGLPEVSKGNIGDGWYAGAEVEAAYGLRRLLGWEQWSAFAAVDYLDGRIDQTNDAGQNVRDRVPALPPATTGLIGLRYESDDGKRGLEFGTRLAYHVRNTRYGDSDRNDGSRIPPHGLPGYAVFHVRGWTELCPKVTASLAVENLNDTDYRIMGSGLNEPGTNVILTVQARF